MSRPLPPEIYRRRRIVLLAGLLGVVLVLWVLVRTVTGGGDAEPEADPTSTPTATETAVETPEGTVPVSLTTGEGACKPQSVRITPSVPADQAAGGDVQILLTISSTATEACVLDADDAQLVVIIDDGDNPVYDSTACTTSLLASPVQLSPEWATVTTVTWNGRVSGGSCGAGEALVGGGSYTLKLGTLGGEPGDADFTLADAPPPPAPVVPDPAVPDPAATPAPDPAATDPAAMPPG